jgi:hypothetical protein
MRVKEKKHVINFVMKDKKNEIIWKFRRRYRDNIKTDLIGKEYVDWIGRYGTAINEQLL